MKKVLTDDIEDMWNAMHPPLGDEEISGRRIPGLSTTIPAYLAIDRGGFRHLFILTQKVSEVTPIFHSNGLRVSISKFKIGTSPENFYLDFHCYNPRQNSTFSAVVIDVIHSIKGNSSDLLSVINETIARWRDFWTTRTSGMSMEETLGLFGEIWFMLRWFPTLDSQVIRMWQSTVNARHDFQGDQVSVEVKTANTRTTGAPVHHISGLEQLDDPQSGKLYLFSLQVTDDALSNNTLHSLVNTVQKKISGDYLTLSDFNTKVVSRGYTLDDTGYPALGYRILSERLYKVTDRFPRIVRRSFVTQELPSGISNIKYNLDMAGSEPWLVARSPTESGNPLLSKI